MTIDKDIAREAIATICGVAPKTVEDVARRTRIAKPRAMFTQAEADTLVNESARRQEHKRITRHPDPTPEEIREQCLAIQANWTDKERYRRAGVNLNAMHVETMVCRDEYFRPPSFAH